jgi:hypothetical protein
VLVERLEEPAREPDADNPKVGKYAERASETSARDCR